MKETLPECIKLQPPNCVSALVHWRPLAALLVLLPPTISLHLHNFDQMCNRHGALVEEIDFSSNPICEVADAHMHPDKFITDMGQKGMLSRIRFLNCCHTPCGVLCLCIANNSFLSESNEWQLQPSDIEDSVVKMAYSIHPKTAGQLSSSQFEVLLERLHYLLQHPKTVVLTKVGIDFSKIDSNSEEAELQ